MKKIIAAYIVLVGLFYLPMISVFVEAMLKLHPLSLLLYWLTLSITAIALCVRYLDRLVGGER